MAKKQRTMNVSFDGFRQSAATTYDALARLLNEHIDENGYVHIKKEHLQKEMDNMRTFTVGALCFYEEGNPEMNDLSHLIEKVAHFNPE